MNKIEIIEAKIEGYTALVEFFDDEVQIEKKLYLCSRMNPVKEGRQWANSVYSLEVKHFIIYGMGLGYHIQGLLELINENQYIHILECNTELYTKCLPYIGRGILESAAVEIIQTEDPNKIRSFFKNISTEKSKFAAYLPCIKVIPPKLIGIKQVVDQRILDQNTQGKFAEIVTRHYEINEKKGYQNVSRFFGKYKDKPMILVSAGPSLETVLEDLKNVKEDIIIFATGRVLKLLLKNNIRVDFFCIMDPCDELTIKQIDELEQLNIPFIFLNKVGPLTIESYKGPKYMAYSKESDVEQEGRIETGGSVATAVLDLGIKFGCNPIIFVGQDLAHSNNLTHCRGLNGKICTDEKYRRKVKAIDGGFLPTTVPLLSFKKWIEKRIRDYPEISFINATTYGAYIEGCKHQSLSQTLKQINNT